MNFSILIATYFNSDYLKNCIDSILKNSYFKKHQILVHVNGNDHKAIEILKKKKIFYKNSITNLGLCKSINFISNFAKHDFLLYAHDDMYFLPYWDYYLYEEVKNFKHNKFYLSSTQISPNLLPKNSLSQHISANFGETLDNFKEKLLLENFNNFNFYDLQGSHWAPHLIHKDIWNEVGGFSEEFNLGDGSDPDLAFKLWNNGIRIFKMVSKSRVYHFGSLTTRKSSKIKKNNGSKTFLLKWGISVKLFTRHFLRRGEIYNGPLNKVNINLNYIFEFLKSKIKFFYFKLNA